MTALVPDEQQHPLLASVQTVTDELTMVADANPSFLSTDDKSHLLTMLARVEAQVGELRLRVMADAADVAAQTASRDVAAWLHRATNGRIDDLRADQRLAIRLDRAYGIIAASMRGGDCNLAQAHVIAKALDNLPDDIDPEIKTRAEQALIDHTDRLDPTQLRKLGRHILDLVAPEIADAEEARRLANEEAHARRKTRLSFRRNGDGTTRINGVIADAVADRFETYLEAFASPRRDDGARTDAGEFLPYERRLGHALGQFLEAVDPSRLPIHGGDATTVIVKIDLADLYQELGIAETGLGTSITAAEARRLACNATILPAVLGSHSELIDLGRGERLFTSAQRKALLLRSSTCEAEGCTIPGTWSEAHHWLAWAKGGSTDIANAALLCAFHHHRAHDPAYVHERLADGAVRFIRRR